jgi:micrococcal nuclease
MKNKWYFRWWAWVIYALVAIGIVNAVSAPTPTTNKSSVAAPAIPATPIPDPVAKTTETPVVLPTSSPQTSSNLYRVVKVVDGDTITVEKNGSSETLRLIGINTPETVDPRKPVECFGEEASNKAKELLMGQQVRLEADPTQGERDKYDRLLRYVFLTDGTFYNKVIIQQGYAYEYTYNTPYKYQVEFKRTGGPYC